MFNFSTPSLFAAVTSVILISLPVYGQQAVLSYDDEMARIRAQKDILREQAELRVLLQQAGGVSPEMPSVVAIFGIDGQYTARLQLASGSTANYSVGDAVRGGLVVSAITAKQVTVRTGLGKNGKSVIVPLEFAAGTAPGMPGMPGMPPGFPNFPRGPVPTPRDVLPAAPNIQMGSPPAPRAPSPAPVVTAPAGVAGVPVPAVSASGAR